MPMLEDRMLIIVPSRTREEKIIRLIECFKNTTTGYADLCVGIDDDDLGSYPWLIESREDLSEVQGVTGSFRVFVEINPRLRMVGTLNLLASKYAPQYRYIGFMGDDHAPRTIGWDWEFYRTLKKMPLGIIYGNDLLQGANLPTAVALDSNIISILGYMGPPKLKHLMMDNFWKILGTDLGTLAYRDDIIIEHMHFTAGKDKHDEIYADVNAGAFFSEEGAVIDTYLKEQYPDDFKKLRNFLKEQNV